MLQSKFWKPKLQVLLQLDQYFNDDFLQSLRPYPEQQRKSGCDGHGEIWPLQQQSIAATLAKYRYIRFLRTPGEAAHGDLGMIGTGDVVIAISTRANQVKSQAYFRY